MVKIKLPHVKVDKEKLVSIFYKFLFILLRSLQWFIIILAWILSTVFFVSVWVIPYVIVIVPIVVVLIRIFIKLKHLQFLKYAEGNTIIHGGRGKGKGLLFQYLALKQSKLLSNVSFGSNTTVIPPKAYFESITPNDAKKMVEGKQVIVKKNDSWEGVPYLLDDSAVYLPNYLDNVLKIIYPSMSLMIPIQRHLYDSWTCVNVQSIERMYKILRELQTDGYIKALSTSGKGYIWKRLPFVRKYFFVRWRYHENLDSALNNVLPIEKMGLLNRTADPLYTTSAEAMRKVYEGQFGVIHDGFIWIKKKHIYYDTRVFHETLFGYKAP